MADFLKNARVFLALICGLLFVFFADAQASDGQPDLMQYPVLLPALIFGIAALYASVGHGGASGYLAVLSLTAISPAQLSTTALTLNVLVAGVALLSFAKAGHFRFSITWPFLVPSIPAAFLGAMLPVSQPFYFILLAVVLAAAAFRLAVPMIATPVEISEPEPIAKRISLPTGGLIGFLSGIVGVGGGIFLSPIMILFHWADAKKTSAAVACFIVANSLAGLSGRAFNGTLNFGDIGYLPMIAFGGGLLGAYIGANRLKSIALRRVLAGVLSLASLKLFLLNLN
jgi:uncharacterized membrane protein YfcA